MYTNDKIKKLIEQRNAIDKQIEREIENERKKYKFSWERFLFMVGMVVLYFGMIYLNGKIFSPDSIWSWQYYFG